MGLFEAIKNLFSQNKENDTQVVKDTKEDENEEVIEIEDDKDKPFVRMNFEVKGTFVLDRQKTIRSLIKQIKKEDEDFGFYQYEGLTNNEIKDYFGEKVYQYNETLYFARLEDEPNNTHDKNAIKVNIVDSEGNNHFVGYVPKELTLDIKKLRRKYDYHAATTVTGGKFKQLDFDSDNIKTGTEDYTIEIFLSFWVNLPDSIKEELIEVGIK